VTGADGVVVDVGGGRVSGLLDAGQHQAEAQLDWKHGRENF
jgi:hypothetical protein